MATVTANIKLTSPDITSDVLSVEQQFNMTTNGTIGVDEIVGVSRRSGLNARTTIFASATYTSGGIVYIKNTDTTFANGVLIEINDGTDILELGEVAGGEAFLIPWNGANDFQVTAANANTVVEFALFVK